MWLVRSRFVDTLEFIFSAHLELQWHSRVTDVMSGLRRVPCSSHPFPGTVRRTGTSFNQKQKGKLSFSGRCISDPGLAAGLRASLASSQQALSEKTAKAPEPTFSPCRFNIPIALLLRSNQLNTFVLACLLNPVILFIISRRFYKV